MGNCWQSKTQLKLRYNMTKSEWRCKSYLESHNINFVFQEAVRGKSGKLYFADFYFPKTKTILEIDGGYHNTKEQKVKDKERTIDLKNKGFRVIRITNNDVNNEKYPKKINRL